VETLARLNQEAGVRRASLLSPTGVEVQEASSGSEWS
jgi:hypothetical protein